jgi:15-cis-phytoene synthase
MTNLEMYNSLCLQCSKRTTEVYSTSFASAINLLHKDLRQPIHSIYGFVRFADEIVDTFHAFEKKELLLNFKKQTWLAIEQNISLNPILHSFQQTLHHYKIPMHLVESFLYSMELDLGTKRYDEKGYTEYIYGSAEVVGLMCLKVFCEGDEQLYQQLIPYAQSLGAAFQKINFLRDIKADNEQLGRMYFPGCDFKNFAFADKETIEADIQQDFENAYRGIVLLPLKARLGVYVAYRYYFSLFQKIKRMQPKAVLQQRIRIPNYVKAVILAKAGLKSRLNLIS